MPTRRDAILKGVVRATELHKQLGIREALASGDRPIDVLGAVRDLDLFLLFRPLDGLLGAYFPNQSLPGMLVTTKRDLHVQRFTAAHELGHHVLGHKAVSLDENIGFVGRGEIRGMSFDEVEADSFASEFLLPKWHIVAHIRRQGWNKRDITQPDVVYQLSLRLGASYAATCWALQGHSILDTDAVARLVKLPPLEAKKRAAPGVSPDDWRRDVWVLSERDRGMHVLGGPDDFIVLNLDEHVSGGYTWDASVLPELGLNIEQDERHDENTEAFGSPVRRRLVLKGPPGSTRLKIEERRTWDSTHPTLNTFELDLALLGREPEGIPRANRLLAA